MLYYTSFYYKPDDLIDYDKVKDLMDVEGVAFAWLRHGVTTRGSK